MKKFDTSTHLLNDNDVENLNTMIKKARSSLINYSLLCICLPFLVPFFKLRSVRSWKTFDFSDYWIIVLMFSVVSLVCMIIVLKLYFLKVKAIKEDLADNTKQILLATVENENDSDNNNENPNTNNYITHNELQILASNAGGSKNEIDDLKFFCSKLKSGDKLVIEYATQSGILLSMIKQ